MADISVSSFANIARTDIARVRVNQDHQGLEQAGNKTGFFDRFAQNNTLHTAFKQALTQKFGSQVAGQAMKGSFRFSSLSSRKISTILDRALIANNKQRVSTLTASGSRQGGLSPALSEGLRMISGQHAQKGVYDVVDRVAKGEIHGPDRRTGAPGTLVGGFEFLKLKDKGVEPGFMGRVAWTRDHTAEMNTPQTGLNRTALAFVDEQMALGPESMEPEIRDSLLRFLKDETGNTALTHSDLGPILRTDTTGIAGRARTHIMADANCAGTVREAVRQRTPELSQKHYIKLDYAESDMRKGLFGRSLVQITRERSKGTLHRFFTAKTKLAANTNAMKEVMASDLMRAMGIETQKAHLLRASYSDGSTKLLVEAPHMQMVSDSGQVQRFSDFSGRLVDGFIVETDQELGTPGQAIQKRDSFTSDTSMATLGRNKIFMLALADRDAIGSRGDNKGRIGNTFAAIDPGHSLEGLMGFRNINSDFSFENGRFAKFKNFSVFDDSTYSEKFEGVRQLQTMRQTGSDLEVFENYGAWLDSEMAAVNPRDKNADQVLEDFQSMKSELLKMKDAWISRRDYILDDVFGERLQVADDPPGVLESLDCLEKLSSETRLTSPSGRVRLNHLQVKGARVEWHVARDLEGDGYLLHATAGKSVMERLEAFFAGQKPPFDPGMSMDGNQLKLHIPGSRIQAFNQAMAEPAVIAFKEEK